jgi:hypothetical protein
MEVEFLAFLMEVAAQLHDAAVLLSAGSSHVVEAGRATVPAWTLWIRNKSNLDSWIFQLIT